MKNFDNFLNEELRKSTEQEKEIFTFLNDLRDSGSINMFGAGPEISNEFGIDKREAREFLSLWMSNFNEDGDYEEINDKN